MNANDFAYLIKVPNVFGVFLLHWPHCLQRLHNQDVISFVGAINLRD